MSATAARARKTTYSSPRQKERQRRILAVVREQISKNGYEALGIRELAAASGVAVKTLYNLYGSKDELLLAAVAELLSEVQHQRQVIDAGPGIERYLAYTEAIARQIAAAPAYADTMARTLFQAPRDHRLVDVLLGNSLRLAQESLQQANTQGELVDSLELEAYAQILAGHQWSLVLLWSKGLLELKDLAGAMQRSCLITLIPVCRERRRKQLERRLVSL